MTLAEYQTEADKTAQYPDGIHYTALGLCGEAGEFADKLKKIMRDNRGQVSSVKRVEMLNELGDVLWYVAQNAKELNSSIGEVAQLNVEKLADRQRRGKIGGSGDRR